VNRAAAGRKLIASASSAITPTSAKPVDVIAPPIAIRAAQQRRYQSPQQRVMQQISVQSYDQQQADPPPH